MTFKTINTPIGSVWFVTHDEDEPRWFHHRGRTREHIFRAPFLGLDVEVHGRGKSYRELTGCPKLSLDWILDEFDSSFNDLAIASLKFHLGFSICDNERYRELYEDLIARLSEESPHPTVEESAAIDTWDFMSGEKLPDGSVRAPRSNPEARAAFRSWQEREDAWAARIRQARHDFVDIMPGLWS